MATQISDLSRFVLGDIVAIYLKDGGNRVGLMLLPLSKEAERVTRRADLSEELGMRKMMRGNVRHSNAWGIDSLAQVKWTGISDVGHFAQGRTMRSGPATNSFTFAGQAVARTPTSTTVVTTLKSGHGFGLEHRLTWRVGDAGLTVSTTFLNASAGSATLEMLSSFSLMGVSPFAVDDAPGRLRLHRFRGSWSAEGRSECCTFEDLGLERSWAGHGMRCERFGQIGSLPTNGFFPTAGVEDSTAGVVWAAQLAWAGSWQMEAFRLDDCAAFSGGLADAEYGHWRKTIAPGGSFAGPVATITVAAGSISDACQRLVAMQAHALATVPAVERSLPVIFNEYCTSWGNPTHENLIALADRLKGEGVEYLVIDAGWYKPDHGSWGSAQGDWEPNKAAFPYGLEGAAAAIRERGMIPGVWFEFEVACHDAKVFKDGEAHFLKRDGQVLNVGGRRYWDMNDPWVIDYLSERVIEQLRRCQIGYMKIDYNDNIGVGCDGAESAGEGLRRHIEGVYAFLRRIHAALPDLVIENCSSGGHRLEPSMMALTSMSSFSDAHETEDIPVIAAQLHNLMLPQQSQIWAVLHSEDDERRLLYLLTSTFLGRMCLSGDVHQVSAPHWNTVRHAIRFYGECREVIRAGHSTIIDAHSRAWRHLTGWQAVVRVGDSGNEALIVLHAFGGDLPADVTLALPVATASAPAPWRVVDTLGESGVVPRLNGASLALPVAGAFSGVVVLLRR